MDPFTLADLSLAIQYCDGQAGSRGHMQFDQLKRREFIALLGGVAVWPLTGHAQPSADLRKIGILASQPLPPFQRFVRKLREYGYIEGQNVRFVSRFAEGRDDRYPAMAAELAALSLDLIVTWGTPAALAAKQATRTIPVVMAAIGDHKSKDCFHHGLDRSADAHCSRRRGN